MSVGELGEVHPVGPHSARVSLAAATSRRRGHRATRRGNGRSGTGSAAPGRAGSPRSGRHSGPRTPTRPCRSSTPSTSYQAGPSSSTSASSRAVDRGPPLDHRGALLDQPPQRIGRSLTGVLAQPFRVQQRQPGQQLGVDAVVLGVLGVVLTQVRRLGRRDHHHPRPAAAEPLRHHDPGVPGRLDAPRSARPDRPGPDPPTAAPDRPAGSRTSGHATPGSVPRQRRLMRGPDGHVDAQRQCHLRSPVSQSRSNQVTDQHGHGPDIL